MPGKTFAIAALALSVTTLISTAQQPGQTPPTTPPQTPPSAQPGQTPAQPGTRDPSQRDQNPRTAPPTPTPQDRTRTPGGDMQGQNVLQSLEGTWSVTMKMPAGAGGAPSQIRGIATRSWILDGTVLEENFRVTSAGGAGDLDNPRTDPTRRPGTENNPGNNPSSTDPNNPGRRPGGPNAQEERSMQDISMGFEGLGLFSMNPQTREVSHVWADSASQGLILSVGRFNAGSKTITFNQHAGDLDKATPPTPPTPPSGGAGENNQDRPGAAGGQDSDKGAMKSGSNQPLVTLRIVSDTEHVVTMTKPGQGGRSENYEITYTKQGAGAGGMGGDTPRRPGTGSGTGGTGTGGTGTGAGNNPRPGTGGGSNPRPGGGQ